MWFCQLLFFCTYENIPIHTRTYIFFLWQLVNNIYLLSHSMFCFCFSFFISHSCLLSLCCFWFPLNGAHPKARLSALLSLCYSLYSMIVERVWLLSASSCRSVFLLPFYFHFFFWAQNIKLNVIGIGNCMQYLRKYDFYT